MLIVSSLQKAHDAYKAHSPARVISLLSDDEELPSFEGLTDEAHLKLYVLEDASTATISKTAKERAQKIIDFLGPWDGAGGVLVHCNRGVARSMAAAYIVLCLLRPDDAEETLAQMLRDGAPHADPCPMLITYADDLLDRDGRMIDAIEDLCPPVTDMDPPLLILPLKQAAPQWENAMSNTHA